VRSGGFNPSAQPSPTGRRSPHRDRNEYVTITSPQIVTIATSSPPGLPFEAATQRLRMRPEFIFAGGGRGRFGIKNDICTPSERFAFTSPIKVEEKSPEKLRDRPEFLSSRRLRGRCRRSRRRGDIKKGEQESHLQCCLILK